MPNGGGQNGTRSPPCPTPSVGLEILGTAEINFFPQKLYYKTFQTYSKAPKILQCPLLRFYLLYHTSTCLCKEGFIFYFKGCDFIFIVAFNVW